MWSCETCRSPRQRMPTRDRRRRTTRGGAYVVEEEPPDPAEQRAVDGRDDAADERPRALPVVRDRGVRVVQERAHDCAGQGTSAAELWSEPGAAGVPILWKVGDSFRAIRSTATV